MRYGSHAAFQFIRVMRQHMLVEILYRYNVIFMATVSIMTVTSRFRCVTRRHTLMKTIHR